MARRGENIYKRKDGRYEGRYVLGKTESGKTRFGYVYAKCYSDVRQKLLHKKAEQFEMNTGKTYVNKRKTLSSYIAYWIENELAGTVKESSFQAYMNLIRRHLLPDLGKMHLSEITQQVVYTMIKKKQIDGYAHNTIKSIYRLLASIMRCAYEDSEISKNPCRKIRVEPTEALAQKVLSCTEQEKLRSMAEKSKDIPVLLALNTGMRLGEICALKWSDIDWIQKTITVNRTVSRLLNNQKNYGEAKTALLVGIPKSFTSIRTLPIPEYILPEMLRLQKDCGENEFIFGENGRPAEPRTMQRRFMRLVRKANIKGVHFHTMRHSFATRLLEMGTNIKTVSSLLGHSSTRITMDFYAHYDWSDQRLAVEQLSAHGY